MDFVLVPGPWMGAWVWDPVADALRALGHDIHQVSLSGLDDPGRDASEIGLRTHVDDVLAILVERDLRDAIVVAHDCTGVVAGMVADRAPDRIAETVYVEGFVPRHGKSALDAFPDFLRDDEIRVIEANRGRWPVPDVVVFEEDPDISLSRAEYLVARCTPHPGRALTEPAELRRPVEGQRSTFIVCTKDHFGNRLPDDIVALREEPTWTFRSIDAGHWPMVSAPAELTALLDDTAASHG